MIRFCPRAREIRMRRLSPFLLFRRDTFADFAFFAMTDLFRGTETLAHSVTFGKARTKRERGALAIAACGASFKMTAEVLSRECVIIAAGTLAARHTE